MPYPSRNRQEYADAVADTLMYLRGQTDLASVSGVHIGLPQNALEALRELKDKLLDAPGSTL